MSEGRISLGDLTKRFGDVTAVDNIDLEIRSGESLVVLGPSGSGKSTLLRTIAGLESSDSGTITIGGVNQVGLPPHRRDVAIVFQHFALYPHLSALENITLGLRHGLKLGKTESLRRAEDIAERMDITALLNRRPREMSGGQRQRVALARALARQARVVLLDEPLSGLDAQLRLTLRAEIATLLRETGATSIHVTHDQNDAMAMADRIAVFDKGHIQQLGTPDDLYGRPNSIFVAGFIGSPPMNLIQTREQSGSFTTPFGTLRTGAAVRSMVLGIRPEQILIDSDSGWTTHAIVTAVEHEGPSKIVHLDLFGTAVRARVRPELGIPVGDLIRISCDPAEIQIFDGTTGELVGPALESVQRTPSDIEVNV